MKKQHIQLHRRIRMLDFTYAEIAERIGMSAQSFSRRMTGRAPFTEPEMQKLLDELGQPEETLADLFPRRQI